MINMLVMKIIYDMDINVDEMIMVCLNVCAHNHFKIEIFCPSRDVVLYSFTD